MLNSINTRIFHSLIAGICLIFATQTVAQDFELLDPQRQYANSIPGFAGLFFEDGRAVINLTVDGNETDAYDELKDLIQSNGIEPDQTEFRRVQLDYKTLALWQDRLTGLIPNDLPVTFIDADEVANKLAVGVENEEAVARVLSLAEAAGIPGDFLAVSVEQPMQAYARLSSQLRPLLGGVRIGIKGPDFSCTLGFIASLTTGDHRTAAIVNSHCTQEMGSVDGSEIGQPALSSSIGVEVDDPAFSVGTSLFGGPCPFGGLCRYSEAARIILRSDVGNSLAGIARPPLRRRAQDGFVSLFDVNASFRIVGKKSQIFVGLRLEKVGATTAWTKGTVTRSCATTRMATPMSGTGSFHFICQSHVMGLAGRGDSGAPVFEISNTNASEVMLSGLLWGGNDADLYVFSPISNIELELGELTVHTDRVHPDHRMPDLIPVNPNPDQASLGLCRTDEYGHRLITIRNRSRFHVPIATTTRIVYGIGEHVDLSTPPIKAFEEVTLRTPVHEHCDSQECSFTIFADAGLELDERAANETDQHETNNVLRGHCLN